MTRVAAAGWIARYYCALRARVWLYLPPLRTRVLVLRTLAALSGGNRAFQEPSTESSQRHATSGCADAMCLLRLADDVYAATHHSHSYGFSPRCADDR